MVQRLSLMATIADDDFPLFKTSINILTGSPAVVDANLMVVWKPNPNYEVDNLNSKNELVEPTRMTTATSIPLELILNDPVSKNNGVDSDEILNTMKEQEFPIKQEQLFDMINNPSNNTINWTLTTADIPAAGSNRKVSMQAIQEATILHQAGNNPTLANVMAELGYSFDYMYVTVGVRFVHKRDVIIHCHKVWDIAEDNIIQVTKGGYVVHTFVTVNRATDIERLNLAEANLLSLQRDLSGYLDFKVPDRKSMDSRTNLTQKDITL